MHDILSLTNPTLLTANMIPLCTKTKKKNLYLIHDSLSPFHRKMYIHPLVWWHPSHLTSSTPTKFNLYFDISLKTVMSEPAPYRVHMFHVPNLITTLLSLGHFSKQPIQVRGSLLTFHKKIIFYGEELLAPHPTSKLEDHSCQLCATAY
jgi:hypothetical protein